MKCLLIGSQGFVGKAVTQTFLQNKFCVVGLSRPQFDITLPETYPRHINGFDTIIDAVSCIDSSPEQINDVNVEGLYKWINYLKSNNVNANYVYFSTISVLKKEQFPGNAYIQSKVQAEQLIGDNFSSHNIIRLTFPFGKGEKGTRLISRLISGVKNKEVLNVGNVRLQLTPISFLQKHIIELIQNPKKTVDFTDGVEYNLVDIVDYLYAQLNESPNYIFNHQNTSDLTIKNRDRYTNPYSVWDEIKKML